MKCIIYVLHHPLSDFLYIGQSKNGLSRPRHHRTPSSRSKSYPVCYWVRKYLDYEITVLEEFRSSKDLDDAEQFYIGYFRSIGMCLLNCTDGGGSSSPSIETRHKMSIAKLGRRVLSDKHYERLSRLFQHRTFTPEWKQKISAAKKGNCPKAGLRFAALNRNRTGQPLSERTKQKLSAAHRGKHPELHKTGEQHPRAKLTQEQVDHIRISRDSVLQLADRFQVSRSTIYAIRSGQNWKAGAVGAKKNLTS
jgi:group I intron endonuclease